MFLRSSLNILFDFYYIYRTSYLARRLGQELQKKIGAEQSKELEITDEEILCLEVAGLCHDLGGYIVLYYRVYL